MRYSWLVGLVIVICCHLLSLCSGAGNVCGGGRGHVPGIFWNAGLDVVSLQRSDVPPLHPGSPNALHEVLKKLTEPRAPQTSQCNVVR